MDTPRLRGIDQRSDGWIKKYVLEYDMPDGSVHAYEAASRKGPEAYLSLLEANGSGSPAKNPDAVCIAARTPRDTLVMIKEFRYPLNSWCIALPAGLIDSGEDPETCVRRELQEETGYTVLPGSPVRLLPQAGYSSTGMSDETVLVSFVEAEKTASAHTEKNELIEVFELPIAEIRAFLDANTLPIGTRAQLILEIFAARNACGGD